MPQTASNRLSFRPNLADGRGWLGKRSRQTGISREHFILCAGRLNMWAPVKAHSARIGHQCDWALCGVERPCPW